MTIRFLSLLLECSLIQLLQTEAADKMLWVEFSEHGSDTAARDCLMTASAKTSTKRMVMLFTIGESLVLKKIAVVERHLTFLAHEAVGMPLQVERGDVVLGNWGVAAAALGGELLKVAGLAEGGVVLLVEPVVAKLAAAFGAEEVFRVEGLVEGGDALVQDRALAVTASWTEETMIVLLTVRSALSLKEVLGAQLLVAMGAGKMLGMPRVAKGGDHLTHNRFAASSTHAFLLGFHALLVHVLLQVSKHVIKIGRSSNNGLVNVAIVHLEVVQRRHQVVQLRSRR